MGEKFDVVVLGGGATGENVGCFSRSATRR